MVGVIGFEPTQLSQQIYSLPQLSNVGAPPFINALQDSNLWMCGLQPHLLDHLSKGT